MADLQFLYRYLQEANIGLIRCVDERQAIDNTNGVEIPGGTYGLIDAIKFLTGRSEEDAWALAFACGIPLGVHTDEYHGPLGCGYAKLVEVNYKAVLAVESVPAILRLGRIEQAGGTVLTLLGDHAPTHAVVNKRYGCSLDPDQAVAEGLGIFNFDKWAAYEFGKMLRVNPSRFSTHLEDVYRHTVTALTGITEFLIVT